jgi:hypothetical protein
MEKNEQYYLKRIEKLKKDFKQEKAQWKKEMHNLRDLQEQQLNELEKEITQKTQLIGIMKTGRIKYRKNDGTSGMVFLQELQQVETSTRGDIVTLTTKSGNKIQLSKMYNYLTDLFLAK